MAIETRTIFFDQTELVQAAYAYCIRQGLALPHGRLTEVRAEPESVGQVRLHFGDDERSNRRLSLSYSQMAAGIILHCGVVGIPLPRYGRKRLTPAGEGMALIVRLPEHAGEAILAEAPEPKAISAG